MPIDYKIITEISFFSFRMARITYNVYDANRTLPDPIWIFKLVRRVDYLMKADPNKNWNVIKEWARPMNQLTAGVFLNITDATEDEIEKKIDLDGPGSDDLKLEMSWIDRGYIRVCFNVTGRLS